MNENKTTLLKLAAIAMTLLIQVPAQAVPQPRPGDRYNHTGFNLGAGGVFTGEFHAGSEGLGGGYWFEAGYGVMDGFLFATVNLGALQSFPGERFTLYADVSALFLSAGPLVAFENGEAHPGGFLAVNIPFLFERYHRYRGADSGDLFTHFFVQVRAEMVWGLPDVYTIGVMGKLSFLEWFDIVPGDPADRGGSP